MSLYTDQLPPTMRPAPGPWHIEPSQWDHGASIAICNKQQGVLAIIQPLNDAEDAASAQRDPCDYANAHLMAAAPELREAIPPLIRLVHRLLPAHSQSDSTLDNLPEVFQARAALAKSTAIHQPNKSKPIMTRNLPPDPENKNDARAAWAGKALATFIQETSTDKEDALGDLLTDLMHWCDRNNYEFNAALDRARGHYGAETIGE